MSCGCSLEVPRRGASNEYPQHMFVWRDNHNYLKSSENSHLYLKLLDSTENYLSLVMRKPAFGMCENKDADQISFAVTAKLISSFVFAIRIVQSLFYLIPKFQASSHLLWLYSPICVGPGRKPRRPVFSQRGSFFYHTKQTFSTISPPPPYLNSRFTI